MPHILEIDSVIKSFKGHKILTDIYLKCQTGDIVGLFGRNGTGKTTLLKILFGSISAERKFICIDSKIISKPYKEINQLCYLPQDSFIPRYLSVSKSFSLFLGDKSSSFFDDPILKDLKNRKISSLSGGEVRYIEVKLLLNLDVKFILLDEPFNGVSPILIDSIKNLIIDASKSKGIIVTDHDYRNVLDIANRNYLIFDGGIKVIREKNDLAKWGYLV
jgi:lipopolysaccharide export system ATP-binding protein